MPVEIEKKFLVKDNSWTSNIESQSYYCQGYLSTDKLRTVRVRTVGEKGYITIKGIRNGISRPEYEYEIPYDDALEMLNNLCMKPLIEKTRYKVYYSNMCWEVDVFEKENRGLVIAEIELESEDTNFDMPPWAGEEVTADPRYSNSNLVKNPYSTWDNSIPSFLQDKNYS